jgi:hypothetical protein
MPSDHTGLHIVPTFQDLRRRIEAKLDRLIVPPTPQLTQAQVSHLCIQIMRLSDLACERPGVILDFTPGEHALHYWTALHFIDEISWMPHTIHQTTLEATRKGMKDMSAQFKAFDMAIDAFVGCHPDNWPPADFEPWEPPADTLHPPFWADPPNGKPQQIALHLLPMVPSHAELRERVRRKIENWAPANTAPMPEHTLNQVCLAISMLGCEKSEQDVIERATSVHRFTNQQAMLSWCAELFIEEIDLLSHAGVQGGYQARRRGITDKETLRARISTALQEFIGTEDQWHKGYNNDSTHG